MTSGGNNFNYFPENQLTILNSPNFIFVPPLGGCVAGGGVPLDTFDCRPYSGTDEVHSAAGLSVSVIHWPGTHGTISATVSRRAVAD